MTSGTVRRRWARFRGGPYVEAVVLLVILTIAATAFAASYSLAFTDPTPHDVPVAVVGGAGGDRAAYEEALAAVGPGTYDVRAEPTRAAALEDMDHQRLLGVIDLGDHQLVVSSASGAGVARALTEAAPELSRLAGHELTVVDRHPLPATDANATSLFYMALASVIIGFVGAMQINVHAKHLRLRDRVLWQVALAVVAPLAIVVMIGPVLGIVHLPLWQAWGVLFLTMLAAGMVCSVAQIVFYRWALLPVWILFVLVGNPSSGGAVAPQLLPPFYEFIGRWLPAGAAVQALRTVTYFDDVPVEPLLVLAGWSLVFVALYVGIRVHRERRHEPDPA